MTPRTALTLALSAATLAACSRGRPGSTPIPEVGVADLGAAYACAADAAQQLGYAVPVGVAEEVRGERQGGGSFTAERRVPRADGGTQVDELRVTVGARGNGGAGVLRVAPWSFREEAQRGADATPTATPTLRPARTTALSRPRTGRAGRGRRYPLAPEAPLLEHAAAVASRCGG